MQTNLNKKTKDEIFSLAYNYENKGLLIYSNFKDDNDIFAQILAIKKNGIILLEGLASIKNYKLQNYDHQVITPSNLDEKLIVCLNYELELNEFYKNGVKDLDDDVKDLFFRLWATSNNEYIPALKQQLFNKNSANKNKNEHSTNDMQEFLDKANLIASGKASKDDLQNLLKNPNFSFFGGIAAGSLVGLMINEMINKGKNDE
ncbi:ferritin-like domain-containing protein [Campylobacter hyointestinalis]|uniref:ferritin-like domain-containing protein n=1 Tax=Campylobacter hyointestinalis TaxID=198 RepID=UPI002555D002|nr:ferritin-like domain-containing protein [Campylobacter hyointestinalis]MDL2346985.1 ferritin-like domain-containing protein [Campylobacter hyointestinalis]MDL2348402.1 ferritin-like domain-containing protein [Campylobacter hyointestinalis]MDL2350472.1 ferritin-like domain-containing protein [Campylobacter hyointestinalis]MDM1025979.1 ferritin-like domain-containing protein [Campylobacter hyointestinalis]MDM1027154.1 ferritin-like domain-containing protein [Campylobacter hyointestinalis]